MVAQAHWQQLICRRLSWPPFDVADTQLCRVHKFEPLSRLMTVNFACEQCRHQQSVSTHQM